MILLKRVVWYVELLFSLIEHNTSYKFRDWWVLVQTKTPFSQMV